MKELKNMLPPGVAEVKLSFEENGGKFNFNVMMESVKKIEYAVVFTWEKEKHYTALIAHSMQKSKFVTPIERIEGAVFVEVVDISDEEVYFRADISELFSFAEAEESSIAVEAELCESGFEDAVTSAFESVFENDMSVENASVEAFVEETEIKSSDIFEGIYESFDALKLPNHNFYVFDEMNPANSSLRIRFASSFVSVESLYLGSKNSFDYDTGYPARIIGNAYDSSGCDYKVFGVLGLNTKEHQPFGGMTGFLFFHKIPDSGLGYWLMYLNEDSGALCLPSGAKEHSIF